MKETKVDKKQSKEKKVGFFKKIGNKIKEVFLELKKVNWPDFKTVVKNTGIVLGIVGIFLVLITAIDFGLGALFDLVTGIGG